MAWPYEHFNADYNHGAYTYFLTVCWSVYHASSSDINTTSHSLQCGIQISGSHKSWFSTQLKSAHIVTEGTLEKKRTRTLNLNIMFDRDLATNDWFSPSTYSSQTSHAKPPRATIPLSNTSFHRTTAGCARTTYSTTHPTIVHRQTFRCPTSMIKMPPFCLHPQITRSN